MKKVILLILAGIALFSFILATSMLWYRFFYGKSDTDDSTGAVTIQIDDSNNTIDESGLIPLDDEEALNLTPYEFTIKNNSAKDAVYNVLIEDSIISDDSTYSNKVLLSRKQLKYQLVLNDIVINSGSLSDVKNNVLDTRSIAVNQVNNYQLRVYVSENAVNTNWQNKYYHFDVRVQMEEDL